MSDDQNITPDAQASGDQDTEGHDIALGSSFIGQTDARVAHGARKDTADRQDTAGKSLALDRSDAGPPDARDVRLTRHDEEEVEGHAVFRSSTGTTNAGPARLARYDTPRAGDATAGHRFA